MFLTPVTLNSPLLALSQKESFYEKAKFNMPLKQDTVCFGAKFPSNKILLAQLKQIPYSDIRILNPKIKEKKTVRIYEKLDELGKKLIPTKAIMTTIQCKNSENKPYQGLFVFSQEGKLLGHIQVLNTQQYSCHLRLLDLDASYSKKYKKVGTALINEAIEKSKQWGFNGNLKVIAHNHLIDRQHRGSPIPFYIRKGFKPDCPRVDLEKLIANNWWVDMTYTHNK